MCSGAQNTPVTTPSFPIPYQGSVRDGGYLGCLGYRIGTLDTILQIRGNLGASLRETYTPDARFPRRRISGNLVDRGNPPC